MGVRGRRPRRNWLAKRAGVSPSYIILRKLTIFIPNTIYVQTNKFTPNITLTSVGSTIFQLITIILTTYSLYTNPPNPRVIAIRCDLVTSRLLGNPSPDQLIVHVELSRFTIISTALVSDFFSLKFFFYPYF